MWAPEGGSSLNEARMEAHQLLPYAGFAGPQGSPRPSGEYWESSLWLSPYSHEQDLVILW